MEKWKRRRDLGRLSERLVNAQEEERRRIARELHDEIGQSVSASLVELGRLESTPPHSQAYGERLASMRRMLEGCVSGVRDMALLLRPSMLDDLGLVAALKWQARELTRRTEFDVRMVTEELADDLPTLIRRVSTEWYRKRLITVRNIRTQLRFASLCAGMTRACRLRSRTTVSALIRHRRGALVCWV